MRRQMILCDCCGRDCCEDEECAVSGYLSFTQHRSFADLEKLPLAAQVVLTGSQEGAQYVEICAHCLMEQLTTGPELTWQLIRRAAAKIEQMPGGLQQDRKHNLVFLINELATEHPDFELPAGVREAAQAYVDQHSTPDETEEADPSGEAITGVLAAPGPDHGGGRG